MKRIAVLLILGLVVSLAGALASPETEVTKRASDLAALFATESSRATWTSKILPEYWHPQGNDSGLPARYPSFPPAIDMTRGTFLYNKLETGRVVSGNSPWILEGKETVYCVELLFSVVAQVNQSVSVLKASQVRSQFYVMALDKSDGKWKFIQSYPYRASFYEIPNFLKSWERILGEGSVKNIPEVRQQLLDLVKK